MMLPQKAQKVQQTNTGIFYREPSEIREKAAWQFRKFLWL
jgi:hypothetical protein